MTKQRADQLQIGDKVIVVRHPTDPMFKGKKWPNFKIGDVMTVGGEYYETQHEQRLGRVYMVADSEGKANGWSAKFFGIYNKYTAKRYAALRILYGGKKC